MKVADFEKFKSYFEANPEATEAPDTLLEEKESEAPKPEVTLDLIKELTELKTAIAGLQELKSKQETDSKSEIEELKSSVKDLTAEMQKSNRANSELPKEQTADDILREFFTGGK